MCANEAILLLSPISSDERAESLPIPLSCQSHAIGEICIGGAGVARGYLRATGDASATYARSPFVRVPGVGRVYRTGDLARRLADAQNDGAAVYRFLGRRDARVKIGGVRVDVAEVAAACAQRWRALFAADLGGVHVSAEKSADEDSPPELVAYLVFPSASSHTVRPTADKRQFKNGI